MFFLTNFRKDFLINRGSNLQDKSYQGIWKGFQHCVLIDSRLELLKHGENDRRRQFYSFLLPLQPSGGLLGLQQHEAHAKRSNEETPLCNKDVTFTSACRDNLPCQTSSLRVSRKVLHLLKSMSPCRKMSRLLQEVIFRITFQYFQRVPPTTMETFDMQL